jgi:hypothetical protein
VTPVSACLPCPSLALPHVPTSAPVWSPRSAMVSPACPCLPRSGTLPCPALPLPARVPASDTGNDTHTIEGETSRHETSRSSDTRSFDVLSSLLITNDNNTIDQSTTNRINAIESNCNQLRIEPSTHPTEAQPDRPRQDRHTITRPRARGRHKISNPRTVAIEKLTVAKIFRQEIFNRATPGGPPPTPPGATPKGAVGRLPCNAQTNGFWGTTGPHRGRTGPRTPPQRLSQTPRIPPPQNDLQAESRCND